MTPVILLTDGYLANGAEPWLVPDVADLPDPVDVAPSPTSDATATAFPLLRDDDTLARAWAVPGTPGLEHRIGGLEKDYDTGNISYDPQNHEQMTACAPKGRRHRRRHPAAEIDRRRDAATCSWSAGARPTAPSRGRRARPRAGSTSPTRTCATSIRCRATSASS